MRRWVRYVMPVMVKGDCDDDTVTRVVTLPEENCPFRAYLVCPRKAPRLGPTSPARAGGRRTGRGRSGARTGRALPC